MVVEEVGRRAAEVEEEVAGRIRWFAEEEGMGRIGRQEEGGLGRKVMEGEEVEGGDDLPEEAAAAAAGIREDRTTRAAAAVIAVAGSLVLGRRCTLQEKEAAAADGGCRSRACPSTEAAAAAVVVAAAAGTADAGVGGEGLGVGDCGEEGRFDRFHSGREEVVSRDPRSWSSA